MQESTLFSTEKMSPSLKKKNCGNFFTTLPTFDRFLWTPHETAAKYKGLWWRLLLWTLKMAHLKKTLTCVALYYHLC